MTSRLPRRRPSAMAAVAVLAVLAVVASSVGVQALRTPRLELIEPRSAFPDTIDGVPVDQAPPRAVVTVDDALAEQLATPDGGGVVVAAPADTADPAVDGGDREDAEDADGAASTDDADDADDTDGADGTDDANGAVVVRRDAGAGNEVAAERLGAGDRDLLAALGALDAPDQTGPDPTTPDLAPTTPDPAATSTNADTTPPHDRAARLATHLTAQLGTDVDVLHLDHHAYAVTGAAPEQLQALPGIADAREEVLAALTGDPYLPFQWSLENTGATMSFTNGYRYPTVAGFDLDWAPVADTLTGEGVTVAVVDSAYQLDHPDLADVWWTNPGETCGSSTDHDGNGFPGDCRGWNFATGSWDVGGTTDTQAGHGTHVAGTIAAQRNGVGTVGVAPGVAIMPLVVTMSDDAFPLSRVTASIDYAVANGADIVNLSLGSGPGAPRDPQLEAAVQRAHDAGVLVVVAAGNSSADLDTTDVWPASLPHDNVLTVGAMEADGTRASFSNHGATVVDLTAPGVLVAAPYSGSRWVFMSGTSMAAPNAAGIAALLASTEPGLSPAQLIDRLVTTGTPTPAWEGLAIDAVRPSAAGAVPFADPDAVVFSRLGAYVADDGAEVVPIDTELVAPASANRTVGLTLAVWHDGAAYAVLDHPVAVDVDGAVLELTTDDEGQVRFTLPSDGRVGLATELPLGDYAWIVEPSGREAATGTFSVVDEVVAAPAPSPAPPPPPSEGGDPPAAGDDGAVVLPPGGDVADPVPVPGDDPVAPPPLGGGSQPAPPADDGGGTPPPGGGAPPLSGGGSTPPSGSTTEPAPSGGSGSTPPSGGGSSPSEPAPAEEPSSPAPGGDQPSGTPIVSDPGPAPAPDDSSASQPAPAPSEPSSPAPSDSAPSTGGGNDSGGGGSTGVLPSSGEPGTSVEVRGSWPSDVRVRFGANPAYVRSVGPLSASVIVPSSSVTGPVDVTVLSAGGDVLAVLAGGFTYTHEVATAPGGSTPPPSAGDDGGATAPAPGSGTGGTSPAPEGGSGPDSGGTDPDGSTSPGTGGSSPDGSSPESSSPPPSGGDEGGSGGPAPGDPGTSDPGTGPAPSPGDGPSAPGAGDPGAGDPGSAESGSAGPDGPARTVGSPTQTSSGLTVVRLGGDHPGSGLSTGAWPSPCTTLCRVSGRS